MLSQEHKKGLLVNRIVSILDTTGENVLKQQLSIARSSYNRRSGSLFSKLSQKSYSVKNKTVNPSLVIDYPKHIRFLDMKLNGKGIPKETYAPIYNKPLYGFIFGYAYKQLRYGLSANISDAFIDPLEKAFEAKTIWV
ncbi:hypothetical protein [Plebeiibacterium sediminum]|uniref:Uncharacterized protein n=1 Tax=Plebeiibacterium sediminum TaxID=2992112 RepID=A0AAE3SDB2_9BACT|nr:hypothetical protein [Plebeiobacterium sediminum]MCW3784935.1 hypothetical protein [Plebeiobacterium sediminum]